MWDKISNQLLDLFFPPYCVGCGKIGAFLCENCSVKILIPTEQTCPGCNKISPNGRYCARCRPKMQVIGIISAGYFKDEILKEAIHKFKYERLSSLSKILAGLMIERIKKEGVSFDIVSFVPSSKKRRAWRGYNQAELLAAEIASFFNKPSMPLLKKIKETKPQVGLSKKNRQKNLAGCFVFIGKAGEIQGKKVLIVDDVVTTGTTLNECAKIIRQKGARTIWAATVAKE